MHSNILLHVMRFLVASLRKDSRQIIYIAGTILAGIVLLNGSALAARVSDIRHTKHNLSVSGPGDVKAYPSADPAFKQNQICVFCHTPHGATREVNASGVNSTGAYALWNRKLSTARYATYSSTSLAAKAILDPTLATPLDQPGGSSKLCLSCHDGTLAIGNVNVMWGQGTSESQWQQLMLGTEYDPSKETAFDGHMPVGGYGTISGVNSSGVLTGYTRNLGGYRILDSTGQLGIDLTNDHPISVSYTNALYLRNGELREVNSKQNSLSDGIYKEGAIIGIRGSQNRPNVPPMAPLEPTGPGKVGQVQCAACHDPHIRETDPSVGNQKFLRLNRFQEDTQSASANSEFNFATDIGCKACHDKNFTTTPGGTSTGTWDYSAHANPNVKSGSNNDGQPYAYFDWAAGKNEFPTSIVRGTKGEFPMWQASCLNCHDTHTVQGARWLLREGVEGPISQNTPKAGGNSAIEETCYQCHSSNGALVIDSATPVADIQTEFTALPGTHMPITLADQQANVQANTGLGLGGAAISGEAHSIGGNFNSTYNNFASGVVYSSGSMADCATTTNKCGADFVESRDKLGEGVNPGPGANTGLSNLVNRHAECTDCHNPHRTVKFQNFMGFVNPGTGIATGMLSGQPDAKATHKHADVSLATDPLMKHTNIISGALRGTFGVEPSTYLGAGFNDLPTDFAVKRGDPADTLGLTDCSYFNKATCDGDSKPYVTREYEICMKCHSNYGYSDNNTWPYSDLPQLSTNNANGLTPSGTNGVTHYTNQAREFQAPINDRGNTVSNTSGAYKSGLIDYQAYNQRSWHPVMDSTGRDGLVVRGNNATDISNAFLPPWNNAVGTQTMYCSDCHGPDVSASTTVVPNGTIPTTGVRTSWAGGTNWGPHGSSNAFILKGAWDASTGSGNSDALCFKCHSYNRYALGVSAATAATDVIGGSTGAGVVKPTGFWMAASGIDGHQLHVDRVGARTDGGPATRCDWCHTAVPHGWKNKGLLVNLNDIGPEGGYSFGGLEVVVSGVGAVTTAYNSGPYYMNARLKVINFKPSGQWTAADCGSSGSTGNGQSGLAWMSTSNENCKTPP